MASIVCRRIASTALVLASVAAFVFSLIYIAPGDPAAVIAGDQASPGDIEQMRRVLGLDRPFLVRFAEWSGQILTGDLGTSIFAGLPVSGMIRERIEPTMSLMAIALIVAVVVAVPVGAFAACRAGGTVDRGVMAMSVLGFSTPVFVVAYLLGYVFAVKLGWFPVQGYRPISSGLGPWAHSLALPAASLALVHAALIARIARAAVLDALREDYIRTARSKGVGRGRVLFVHALRNAAAPIVTVVGVSAALLIGGAVVTETVFGLPGLGRLVTDSILRRDYPVIQGVTLLFSVVYVAINLAVDLAYVWLDPRTRY